MSERKDESYHAALASNTRRRILAALAHSAAPVDARSIAAELHLHVTTVRFHLDQLEEARLIRREVGAEKRRGRPRMLYTEVVRTERDESSRGQLIGVLAGALAHRDDDRGQSRAIEAGRAWARALVPEPAETGSRRDNLLGVLDQLGFDPVPDGDTVQLRACPFRDAAREHPQVVCSVHRGLVQEILDAEDGPQGVRLLPFVQPDLCLITSA